ncbi:hypothetical protein BDW72DRAFT_183148 [Aspergillus terricola var. indicus]
MFRSYILLDHIVAGTVLAAESAAGPDIRHARRFHPPFLIIIIMVWYKIAETSAFASIASVSIKNSVLVVRAGWETAAQDRIVFDAEPRNSWPWLCSATGTARSEDKISSTSVPSTRGLDLDGGCAIC